MNQSGSFIPRQNTQTSTRKQVRKRIYLFSYVVYVLFFATLLTVAALYIWELQLNKSLEQEKAALEEARAAFKPSDIERIREINTQLILVSDLLDTHPAVSKVMAALSEVTLQTVQIASFSLTASESDDDVYTFLITGVASDFSTLLFQRDVLENNSIFKAARITNVTYGTEIEDVSLSTKINFDIELDIPVEVFKFDGSNSNQILEALPAVVTTDTEETTDEETPVGDSEEGDADAATETNAEEI